MLRVAMLLPIIGLSHLFIGCNYDSSKEVSSASTAKLDPTVEPSRINANPSAETPIITRSNPLQWKVHFNSKCHNTPNENCTAYYGFSALSNGTYEVGPGPEGQMIRSELSAEDMASLQSFLERTNITTADNSEECIPNEMSDQEITVELTDKSLTKTIARVTKKEFCFKSNLKSEAVAFRLTFENMLARYYPRTFPSSCVNAVHSLERFYRYVKACHYDFECAYLDDKFLPLTPRGFYGITIEDDCSLVRPLRAANRFFAFSNQRELMEKWEIAHELCTIEPRLPSCTPIKDVYTPKQLPRCIEGFCRVPSFRKT